MELFLNFGFAWIAVILTLLSSVIYIFRKIIINYKLKNTIINNSNKILRRYHKHLGVLVVIAGIIHGVFSSEQIFTLNLGTIALVISVLLGLNWSVRKYISKHKNWMYYHRFLTVAFVISIGLHIYDVGGIQIFNILLDSKATSNAVYTTKSEENTLSNNDINDNENIVIDDEKVKNISESLMGGQYKDGTYTGEASAYRDGLVVGIEIKDNTIKSIEIVNHNEVNSRFYQKAFDSIPQRIIDSQSTDVDVTSGATFSSIGIMNAVNNALSKALISGDLPSDKALPANRGHGRH